MYALSTVRGLEGQRGTRNTGPLPPGKGHGRSDYVHSHNPLSSPHPLLLDRPSDVLCVLPGEELKSQEVDLPQLAWCADQSCDGRDTKPCGPASLSGCAVDS